MDEGLNCHGPLPLELIREILARLPVKSLIRFQSVSKGFFILFKSPSFISLHFHHSSQNRPLIFNKNDRLSLLRTQMNEVIEVHPPIPQNPDSYFRVNGSSNGVLCLTLELRASREVYLWNPATMKTRRIPELIRISDAPHDSFSSITCYVMFGFSLVKNDHRVVFLYKTCSNAKCLGFVVYSVSTASLKEIHHDLLQDVTFHNEWVSANGALLWIGMDTQKANHAEREVIISFDLGKETFTRIKMPNYGSDKYRKIQVYKDSVAMLSYTRDGQPNYYVTLWAMDDISDNFREGWTKLYVLELVSGVERLLGIRRNEILVEKRELNPEEHETGANTRRRSRPFYRRCRRPEISMERTAIISLYSSDGQRKKHITTHHAGHCFAYFHVFDYAESLVPI